MAHCILPDVQHIVAVLPTWVGDTVMVTPALRALRNAYPDARMTLFGRPHLFGLLEGGDLFDATLAAVRGKNSVRANIQALRGIAADLAVVFPHSFRSAWQVSRARIPHRVGYRRDGRGWLLTQSLTPHRVAGKVVPVPMVYQYLELVALLGAVADGAGPALPISAVTRRAGEQELERLGLTGERFVVLNPGASFGPSKIWPVEYLAQVADRLQQDSGLKVLIFCGPGEEELADQLEGCMKTPAINTARRILPLDTSKVVMEASELLITTDTGPRHIAVSVDTPAVVLMGSTDPRYTNSHLGRSVVLRKDVPCGPCHLKVCPIDHKCMRDILPEEVLRESLQFLDFRN